MRIFQRIQSKLNWSGRRYFILIVSVLLIGYIASAIYHIYKPLPQGLEFTGTLRHADVKFLSDQTFLDKTGRQRYKQSIFNETLSLIDQAKTMIMLDMFLFNAEVGDSQLDHQNLAQQLTEALIKKRRENPNIAITFVTDPINSVYGGFLPEHYRQLRQAGVDLIETNLTPLRASNPLWSGFWYMCCQGMGNNPHKGWLPNPFGQEKITLRSYLHLANLKANHRKTLVVDTEQGWKTMISSANPHDGSSQHSNVALVVSGATAMDVLKTEQTVVQLSGGSSSVVVLGDVESNKENPQVQLLTEAAIYRSVLNLIENSKENEQIDLMAFYLSERNIIQALKEAQQRGVKVRVLLDPNKDAFGRKKNGIPNRPVASELNAAGVPVRWCDTHGEQCHSKMIIKMNQSQAELILGSANFTARNLKNYNLESSLHLVGKKEALVFQDAERYFNAVWSNREERQMSQAYKVYADESKLNYWMYRFLEWSGLSTF